MAAVPKTPASENAQQQNEDPVPLAIAQSDPGVKQDDSTGAVGRDAPREQTKNDD